MAVGRKPGSESRAPRFPRTKDRMRAPVLVGGSMNRQGRTRGHHVGGQRKTGGLGCRKLIKMTSLTFFHHGYDLCY